MSAIKKIIKRNKLIKKLSYVSWRSVKIDDYFTPQASTMLEMR